MQIVLTVDSLEIKQSFKMMSAESFIADLDNRFLRSCQQIHIGVTPETFCLDLCVIHAQK